MNLKKTFNIADNSPKKNIRISLEVKSKINLYHKRLIIALISCFLLLPLGQLFNDISTRDFEFFSSPIVITLIAIFVIIHTIFEKNTNGILVSVFFIFALPFALTFNSEKLLYFIIICVFPLIAFQLLGRKKGVVALVFFILIIFFSLVYFRIKFISEWSISNKIGEPIFLISVFSFISILEYLDSRQHEIYIKDLSKMIFEDEVTNLSNRKALLFDANLAGEYVFSIVYIGNFNDLCLLFGYDLSDKILAYVAQMLESCIKPFNFELYRLKGNEFGILRKLVDNENEQQCRYILKQISNNLDSKVMVWENKELRLIYNFGAVVFNSETESDYLSKADIALKSAIKHRSKVAFYSDELSTRADALQKAIEFSILQNNRENGTFKAVFQPIIDSATGQIAFYEALLRVKNDEGQYVPPGPYLSIAESAGIERELTHFIVREACDVIRVAKKSVSINLFLSDLMDYELLDVIIEELGYNKDLTSLLILEIIEREELVEIEKCRNFVIRAKEIGCLIAVDDFGSGYSNFANLIAWPLDIVKIDGTLVQSYENDFRVQALVKTIINFCHESGYKIVAEFVDKPELVSLMKGLNIHYLQGYFYGEPEAYPYAGAINRELTNLMKPVIV